MRAAPEPARFLKRFRLVGTGRRLARAVAVAVTVGLAVAAGLSAPATPAAAARATPSSVTPAPSSVTAATGRLDVRIQFKPAFDRILYSHPALLIRGVTSDGANGVNALWERGRGPGMYIEEQRHGEEAIIAGLVHHSPALRKLGLREFAWGFARQGPAGNFPDTHDPFHSTSFFVESTAHLMLVLRRAASIGLAVPRRLLAQVRSLLPRLHRAARWMASRRVWQAGLASDAPYTHRRFLVAAALGLSAVLTGDRLLARRAREALEMGLTAQRGDGVFPELGGFDSSYQARGIVYAEQYMAWVRRAPRSLGRAIARGLSWERTRILPSGEVSMLGNTRANGVMYDHNGPKLVVYPMVATALAWWGLARHRPQDVRVAARISAWGDAHPAEGGT